MEPCFFLRPIRVEANSAEQVTAHRVPISNTTFHFPGIKTGIR